MKVKGEICPTKKPHTCHCWMYNSSTDDSDVKEQKACHQRHYNLCEPSSGEARDEPLLRGMDLVPCVRRDNGWMSSLGDSFCEQAALLFWIWNVPLLMKVVLSEHEKRVSDFFFSRSWHLSNGFCLLEERSCFWRSFFFNQFLDGFCCLCCGTYLLTFQLQ